MPTQKKRSTRSSTPTEKDTQPTGQTEVNKVAATVGIIGAAVAVGAAAVLLANRKNRKSFQEAIQSAKDKGEEILDQVDEFVEKTGNPKAKKVIKAIKEDDDE